MVARTAESCGFCSLRHVGVLICPGLPSRGTQRVALPTALTLPCCPRAPKYPSCCLLFIFGSAASLPEAGVAVPPGQSRGSATLHSPRSLQAPSLVPCCWVPSADPGGAFGTLGGFLPFQEQARESSSCGEGCSFSLVPFCSLGLDVALRSRKRTGLPVSGPASGKKHMPGQRRVCCLCFGLSRPGLPCKQ